MSFLPADGYRAGGELVCLTDEGFPPREEMSHQRTRKSKEPSSEVIRTLRHYFANHNILMTLKTCPDEGMEGGGVVGQYEHGTRREEEERGRRGERGEERDKSCCFGRHADPHETTCLSSLMFQESQYSKG